VSDPLAFRVLPYDVEIIGGDAIGLDEIVRDKLGYLANHAEQPAVALGRLRYRVDVATPDDVLYVLYQRVHRWVIDHLALAGWVHLHAALARIGDRRIVLVGPKGRGKTTLALRLLFDGFEVEGDESVFVRGADVVALPRRFHLKVGAEQIVPELAPLVDALPSTTGDGEPIRAFDPAIAGWPWRLSLGPIHAVAVLAPRGQQARVVPASTGEVLPILLEQVFDPGRLGTPDRLPFALGFVTDKQLLSVRASTPTQTVRQLVDALSPIAEPTIAIAVVPGP
jgi:hypothetical protein